VKVNKMKREYIMLEAKNEYRIFDEEISWKTDNKMEFFRSVCSRLSSYILLSVIFFQTIKKPTKFYTHTVKT
jgi:hypothetical protein